MSVERKTVCDACKAEISPDEWQGSLGVEMQVNGDHAESKYMRVLWASDPDADGEPSRFGEFDLCRECMRQNPLLSELAGRCVPARKRRRL